ncbi:hypothetical protein ACLBWZ_11650 [Brucellaceae bacterium C25G]
MKKTLVLVGNAPLTADLSDKIDNADYVVRFNDANHPRQLGGTKTDLLMVAATSKHMQKRLQEPDFIELPVFKAAQEIMLPLHPSIIEKYHPKPNILSRLKGRRADWTHQTVDIIGLYKDIRIMSPQFYMQACAELGIAEKDMKKLFPSTGFLGIWHILQTRNVNEWDVRICGFTWEGWKRHAWDAERQWIEQKINKGRLSFLN